MKIDPDVAQLPQSPLPQQSTPPAQGESSVFEAMLAGPIGTPGRATPETTRPQAAPVTPGPEGVEQQTPVNAERSPALVAESGAKPERPSVTREIQPQFSPSRPAPTVDAEPSTPPVLGAPDLPATSAAAAEKPLAPDFETALVEAPPPNAPSTPKPRPRDPHHPVRDRAFDFGELGVWGHGGPRDGPAPTRTCGVVAADPKAGPVKETPGPGRDFSEFPRLGGLGRNAEPTPDDVRAGENSGRVRPAGDLGRSPTSSPEEGTDRPLAVRDRSSGLQSPIPSPAEGFRSAETDGQAIDPGGADLPAPAAQSASALSVLVSEGAGGLQVVAAMPDINPDTVARLRRIAESLAREFGLSLAEFSLNGALVDAPSMPDRNPQWR